MDQLNLFGNTIPPALPADLLTYYAAVFDAKQSIALMKTFITTVPWQQQIISMYGKQVATPRLTAWYGDKGSDYTFSGTKFDPIPWTDELLEIKETVEKVAATRFNSVLLNYYRDGNDSVAWHSDDEYELGIKPIIASVSFGQTRRFDVRKKADHQSKYSVELENGSLLLMKGDLQHNWEHRVAKSTKQLKERVNLTFRIISK
ncbi:alpha-ketoglutarate-dependent dioxygenase AlkB family protein [Mucilaginibacter sp.]|uniref:alpha-ketoglutarate-dependent dioxygenase AlkB family protein n=1 Tax=Mucilaginibacter sp. TaxID=1882438 RepID=UPI003D0BA766